MPEIVVNELLCYVQNNFGKYPKDLMGVAILGFYTEQEVSTAKLLLKEFVDSLDEKPDGFPRMKNRMDKDNRRKLECDDILSLFTALDAAKVVLPAYVAADLQRLPTVTPGEVDVFGLAAAVKKLSTQVDSLSKQVAQQAVPGIADLTTRVEALESSNKALPSPAAATLYDGSQVKQLSASSWVTTATCQPGELERMNQRKMPTALKTRVRGSAAATKIKGVPRIPTVAAFVGRLDINTSETDLTDMLSQAGVKVVSCRRLSQKPDAKYKWSTAAFFVSCDASCQDVFYNEATWPEGAELRDWYFQNEGQHA